MQKSDLTSFELPDTPGVYFFRGNKKEILYIGKATSLRDRVKSYFSKDLVVTRSSAIAAMVEKATTLTWETCESVLEALILEAHLIKKHQPPYNTDEKDNKSFNYLVVTKEAFPRVLTIRGRELFDPQKTDRTAFKHIFGPFPQGSSLREALKIVRKIFPFRDTCVPGAGKPCFNAQIGLCPGVCSGAMSAREYAHALTNVVELFQGNFKGLKRRLAHEMKAAAEHEHFEEATRLRKQIYALEHIRDVSLIKGDVRVSSGGEFRIEAYDIAHTAGSETVGVMTVVVGNEAEKNEYRKFKVNEFTNNDVGALSEVLSRRLAHTEWQYPRLIVVDGSVAQMRAAQKVLEAAGVSIPIVGVVKDEHHKPLRLAGNAGLAKLHEKAILLANSEAHRYAISWHRLRQRRSLRA